MHKRISKVQPRSGDVADGRSIRVNVAAGVGSKKENLSSAACKEILQQMKT